MKTRNSLWCAATVLMAGLAFMPRAQAQQVQSQQVQARQAPLRVGQKMPAFSLRDINGRVLSMGKKPLWIAFFQAT